MNPLLLVAGGIALVLTGAQSLLKEKRETDKKADLTVKAKSDNVESQPAISEPIKNDEHESDSLNDCD